MTTAIDGKIENDNEENVPIANQYNPIFSTINTT